MPSKSSSRSTGFKSLADQLADLEDPTPKGLRPSNRSKRLCLNDVHPLDFDPEDPDSGHQQSDEDSESEVDEDAGREHYEKVG